MHRILAALILGLAALPAAAQAPGHYVLALSLQPAFCDRNPDRTECAEADAEAPAFRLIGLHGLWIQPRGLEYCVLPDDFPEPETPAAAPWDTHPPLDLDPDLAMALAEVMPGVASHLDRHEWHKHGSCSHPTPEAYYTESIALVRQAWRSPAIAALSARQGETLSRAELDAILAAEYGDHRLTVICRDDVLAELRFQLTRRGTAPLDFPGDLRPGEIRYSECGATIGVAAP